MDDQRDPESDDEVEPEDGAGDAKLVPGKPPTSGLPPAKRFGERARKLDSAPSLVKAAREVREMLPGDSTLGDSLSSQGRPTDLIARALQAESQERPSTVRQLGLAAVQVFKAMSDPKSNSPRELSILFTDLVEFSTWALQVGDEPTIRLLREVADVVEPAIHAHQGELVKRMGDGCMAVFADPAQAISAALEASDGVDAIEVAGYSPSLRAGIHIGMPRKVGDDYLGVDVNIAARVAEAASGGQVFISGAAVEDLDPDEYSLRKKRFKAKGAPKDLEVYRVMAVSPDA